MKAFKNAFGWIFGFAAAIAILFFGGIGIVALIKSEPYVDVMNVVFDWFKALGK